MNAKGCCKVHGARIISKNSDQKNNAEIDESCNSVRQKQKN